MHNFAESEFTFSISDYYTTVAPQYLRHTKTKIVSIDTCRSIYSYKMEVQDSMICAGYIGGEIDACKVTYSA